MCVTAESINIQDKLKPSDQLRATKVTKMKLKKVYKSTPKNWLKIQLNVYYARCETQKLSSNKKIVYL